MQTAALLNRFLLVSHIEASDPVRRSSPATRAWCARAWPTPSSSTTRTARQRWRAASPDWQRRLSQQARLAARARRAHHRAWRLRWRRNSVSTVTHVERAARLAKADLRTLMVGEFPELQGIMGEYYARHDGEPADVADGDPRALPAALRRRCAAGVDGRHLRRPGRQARDARRTLRHRREADRREAIPSPCAGTRSACCAC